MGKWDILKKHLPKFMGSDPNYDERIKALKADILAPRDPRERPLIPANAMDAIRVSLDNEMGHIVGFLHHHVGDRRFAASYAAAYRDARAIRDLLDAHSKMVGHYVEAYTQLLDSQLDAEDCSSLKLDDGTAVRTQPEPFATVEDRVAFQAWCIENGYLSQMMLPWQTMNALVKERLENADDEPPGVKLWYKNKVVLTKPKTAKTATVPVAHGIEYGEAEG